MRGSADRRLQLLAFGGCVVIALLLYLPTLRCGFVWDDQQLIVNNPGLARASPASVFSRGFWFNPNLVEDQPALSYYRPLSNLTFLLERRVFGLRPFGYHLTNVLINCGVVLLTCLVLLELFGDLRLAAIGGLLAGIHPAANGDVAYISGVSYLLVTLMLLLSFYALVRWDRHRVGQVGHLLLFGLGFLFALLSLEAALAYLVIAFVFVFSRPSHGARAPWLIALLGATAVYLGLRLLVARVGVPGQVGEWALGEPLRVLNSFAHETLLFFFPFTQRVIDVVGPEFLRFSAYSVAGILLLAVPLLLVIWRKSALGAVGYVWAIGLTLPIAHLVFIGPSGRSLYPASLGWLVLTMALLSGIPQPRRWLTRAGWALVGLYVCAFGVQLELRNPVWKDAASLCSAMIREAPQSRSGYAGLADAIAASHPDSAIVLYGHAIALDSTYAQAYVNRAAVLGQKGEYQPALADLSVAVKLRPGSVPALNNLAAAYLSVGQTDSALTVLNHALTLLPGSAQLYFNRAQAMKALGDEPAFEADLRSALANDSSFGPARLDLARRLLEAGRTDSALRYLVGMKTAGPEAVGLLTGLGTQLTRTGDSITAGQCYRRALQMDSTYVPALYDLALLSAAQGDSGMAARLAVRAHRLRPDLQAITTLYQQLVK